MEWQNAKDVAAVWGAVLSTWLLVRGWWQNRPLVIIDCVAVNAGRNPLRLRIKNLGRYPIHIRKIKSWLDEKEAGAVINATVDGWELRDVIRSVADGRLDIVIPADSEATMRMFDDSDTPTKKLLTIHWYSHSAFILPSFPRIIYRSGQELLDLRKHPLREVGKT